MELRFLKGDWEFGKYKLQYRSGTPNAWIDVPTVLGLETEKPLRDRLAEKLGCDYTNQTDPTGFASNYWKEKADIAIDYLRAESQKESK